MHKNYIWLAAFFVVGTLAGVAAAAYMAKTGAAATTASAQSTP